MGKSINQGANHPKFVDLKGKIFGKLTIVEYYPKQDKNKITWYWKCLCECGNYTYTRTKEFTKEKPVQSCRSCGHKRMGKSNVLPNYQSLKNRLYKNYKHNAIKRNYEFNLTKEEMLNLFSKNCHYCGQEPIEMKGDMSGNYTEIPFKRNGIDRIDNSKGYTIGNVISCCRNCNIAKSTMSYPKYINFIIKSYNNLIKLSSTTIPTGSTLQANGGGNNEHFLSEDIV